MSAAGLGSVYVARLVWGSARGLFAAARAPLLCSARAVRAVDTFLAKVWLHASTSTTLVWRARDAAAFRATRPTIYISARSSHCRAQCVQRSRVIGPAQLSLIHI